MANIQEKEWANQGDEIREYLAQLTARGEARNNKLQIMAEKTANVVEMTTNFKRQLEERDKQEADKDAQIEALMQQVQLLAKTMAELTQRLKGEKMNSSTGQNREGETGATGKAKKKCTICRYTNHQIFISQPMRKRSKHGRTKERKKEWQNGNRKNWGMKGSSKQEK